MSAVLPHTASDNTWWWLSFYYPPDAHACGCLVSSLDITLNTIAALERIKANIPNRIRRRAHKYYLTTIP